MSRTQYDRLLINSFDNSQIIYLLTGCSNQILDHRYEKNEFNFDSPLH